MMNGPATYKAIAEALPWEIQTGLLSIREAGDDTGAKENLFYKMPAAVYIAMLELCLITEWSETKRRGLDLTTAGEHLVNFCTC